MSGRDTPSSVVVASVENDEANRCVDLFTRADGSWGFEEYRRDPEDRGAWSRVGHYAGGRSASRKDAVAMATAKVAGLAGRAAPNSLVRPHRLREERQ